MSYLIKIGFVFLLFVQSAFANEFLGVVSFNYDYKLDGTLKPEKFYKIEFTGDNQKLIGHYVEMDNPSVFELKFFRSRNSVIVSGLQVDGAFYRTISGEVVNNKIVGVWHAVGGLKGDFEILKIK